MPGSASSASAHLQNAIAAPNIYATVTLRYAGDSIGSSFDGCDSAVAGAGLVQVQVHSLPPTLDLLPDRLHTYLTPHASRLTPHSSTDFNTFKIPFSIPLPRICNSSFYLSTVPPF
ncbi:uncharacterized protein RSE6_12093 [Rhynchosporium secalis]|uniref:Uncharacterized protein n=1 Tax=Rhynchosporium secalis TaxID=38038 RepID=A0A1E1MPN1_RHYSE|nr:uncharacterized protein RSE6_12093 [Rhynchosporium secalis]